MKYKIVYQKSEGKPEVKWTYKNPEEAAEQLLQLKKMYTDMRMHISDCEHGFTVPCLNITYKLLALK